MAKKRDSGKGKAKGAGEASPAKLEEVFAEVTRRTDAFCNEHLDAEYAALSRLVADSLKAEPDFPLLKYTPQGWAAGIVFTVGWVNFITDPEQKPHMKSKELCRLLGVSESTAMARSKEIRKRFEIGAMDPRLCRESLMDDNPMAWMIQLDNGMIDDARRYPRRAQQQMVDMGLIPYVHPEAKEEADVDDADGVEDGNGQPGNGHPA